MLEEGFFDEGTYIIEDYQVGKISLSDPDNMPYITVTFHSPAGGALVPRKEECALFMH